MATNDIRDLHRQAVERFSAAVAGTAADAWSQPTPCAAWDVRTLVNHVVGENRWLAPLLGGATIADVGDALDGDLLGDDPTAAWNASVTEALDAVATVDLERTVHLSFGDTPAEEYLWQVTTDVLVHAWDLARATGQDETLPGDLVNACASWFDSAEDAYRSAGVIGPPVATDSADSSHALLGRFGRRTSPDDPLAVVVRFNTAFANRDFEAFAAALSEDCRFIDTTPPDGIEHVGRQAVTAAFQQIAASNPSAKFVAEGGFVAGDRVVIQWRYEWTEAGGGHVRGVDLFRVEGGLVLEKNAYVKG